MKKLQYGALAPLLNEQLKKDFQDLTGNRPNSEADLEQVQAHKKDVVELRNDLKAITKHLNRLIVIDTGLEMTIKMREHIDNKLTIFDFGHNDDEDEEQDV